MDNLHNYMEDLVKRELLNMIDQFDCCSCNSCLQDIAAIALNNLPPRYFITTESRAIMKTSILCQQFKATIYSEIVKAITIVSESPRHTS